MSLSKPVCDDELVVLTRSLSKFGQGLMETTARISTTVQQFRAMNPQDAPCADGAASDAEEDERSPRNDRFAQQAVKPFDVPENLIQAIAEPSIDLTKELMSEADVTVATGGMGVVKSAYSSGKPAYGVGPGNVQCIIDRGANVDEAVKKIIASRTFNLGLPCASEQAVIVPEEMSEDVLRSFRENKVVYIDDPEQIRKVTEFLYKDGILNRDGVGITAEQIGERSGIPVPAGTPMILLTGDMREDNIMRKEKLCPASSYYTFGKFDEAVDIARRNILLEGKGHSVAIHTDDQDHIEQLAHACNVTRVVVNDSANFASGGSFLNTFGATTTLGTNFWGNTCLNGNLQFYHLLNFTKIGYRPEGARIPSDEEIWAE